jgi:hypothetical protein
MLAALLLVGLISLLQHGINSPYVLIAAFAFMMLVRLCDQTIRGALIHTSIPPEDYPWANRILETVRQSITFVSGGFAFY